LRNILHKFGIEFHTMYYLIVYL